MGSINKGPTRILFLICKLRWFVKKEMTYKNSSEVFELRAAIETAIGKKLKTPADFVFCTGIIWERMHQNISPTTLKRMWGYIEGADTTRLSTLNLLSDFLGFHDWDGFRKHLDENAESQSDVIIAPTIASSSLQMNDLIEIQWLPNRRCVLKFGGNNKFEVIESEHSKLQVGNTFECSSFLLGQPLYLDNLIQGNNAPVSFVVGKRDGLKVVKKL